MTKQISKAPRSSGPDSGTIFLSGAVAFLAALALNAVFNTAAETEPKPTNPAQETCAKMAASQPCAASLPARAAPVPKRS